MAGPTTSRTTHGELHTDEIVDGLAAAVGALTPLTPRVIALVPAHNEEASVGIALDSLRGQRRRPDLVIVIPDNCSDRTISVVEARGDALLLPTVGNADRKAGALNQTLARLLPMLADGDAVLVMDADSALDAGFVEGALRRLGTRVGGRHGMVIGGVGGTFRGAPGGGFVGMLQRNEYARYQRDVHRLKGRVLVLTGTAALFQVAVLRAVIAARRDGRLPGGVAAVYDTHVLTEDNELTLALLHLGYRILSPKDCELETEVMTTWHALWLQRLRWKRGALENLVDYGVTAVTARYWGRQLLTHIGVLVTAIYLITLVGTFALTGTLHLHAIWLIVTGIFAAERMVSVRSRGWVQMLLAGVLVVEMSFDFFLQAVQAKAFLDTVTHKERKW